MDNDYYKEFKYYEHYDNTNIAYNRTFVNGVEFKNYDIFTRMLEITKNDFIEQQNCDKRIESPNNIENIVDVYNSASKDEKLFIFKYLLHEFIDMTRICTNDKNLLWTKKGRKKHQDFFDKYSAIIELLKDGWGTFD